MQKKGDENRKKLFKKKKKKTPMNRTFFKDFLFI